MVLSSKLKGRVKNAKSKKGGAKGNTNNNDANNVVEVSTPGSKQDCGKCYTAEGKIHKLKEAANDSCPQDTLNFCKEEAERVKQQMELERKLNIIIEGSHWGKNVKNEIEMNFLQKSIEMKKIEERFLGSNTGFEFLGMNNESEAIGRMLKNVLEGEDSGKQIFTDLEKQTEEIYGSILNLLEKEFGVKTQNLKGENNFKRYRNFLRALNPNNRMLYSSFLVKLSLINLHNFLRDNKTDLDKFLGDYSVYLPYLSNMNITDESLRDLTNTQKGGASVEEPGNLTEMLGLLGQNDNGSHKFDDALRRAVVNPEQMATYAANFMLREKELESVKVSVKSLDPPTFFAQAKSVFFNLLYNLVTLMISVMTLVGGGLAFSASEEQIGNFKEAFKKQNATAADGEQRAGEVAAGIGQAIVSGIASVGAVGGRFLQAAATEVFWQTMGLMEQFQPLVLMFFIGACGLAFYQGITGVRAKFGRVSAAKAEAKELKTLQSEVNKKMTELEKTRETIIREQLQEQAIELNKKFSQVLTFEAEWKKSEARRLMPALVEKVTLIPLPGAGTPQAIEGGQGAEPSQGALSVISYEGQQYQLSRSLNELDDEGQSIVAQLNALEATGSNLFAQTAREMSNMALIEQISKDKHFVKTLEDMTYTELDKWLCDEFKNVDELKNKFATATRQSQQEIFMKIYKKCPEKVYNYLANKVFTILGKYCLNMVNKTLPPDPSRGQKYELIRLNAIKELSGVNENITAQAESVFVKSLLRSDTSDITSKVTMVVSNLITLFTLKYLVGDERLYEFLKVYKFIDTYGSKLGYSFLGIGAFGAAALVTTMLAIPPIQFFVAVGLDLAAGVLVVKSSLKEMKTFEERVYENPERSVKNGIKNYFLQKILKKFSEYQVQIEDADSKAVMEKILTEIKTGLEEIKQEYEGEEYVPEIDIPKLYGDGGRKLKKQIDVINDYIISVLKSIQELLIKDKRASSDVSTFNDLLHLMTAVTPNPFPGLPGLNVGALTYNTTQTQQLQIRGEGGGGGAAPTRPPVSVTPVSVTPAEVTTPANGASANEEPEPAPAQPPTPGSSAARVGGARKKSRKNRRNNRNNRTKRNRSPMKSKHQKRRNNGRMSSKK